MKASDLDLLLPQPQEITVPALRWATVTQKAPLRVKLDGDDTALPITPGNTAGGLVVGDRVLTVLTGRALVVLGANGGPRAEAVTRVTRTTNFDPGVETWTAVPWQAEVLDDAGAWSSGDAAKLWVPSWATRAKVTLYTAWTVQGDPPGRYAAIVKNGAVMVADHRRQLWETAGSMTTGWVPVALGDWFSCEVRTDNAASILGNTWGGPSWAEATFR